MTNTIPEMTHPYSKVWRQPKDIRTAPMDANHVLLDYRQFHSLAEYSTSIPSGVYDGKCWKRRGSKGWLLCWYAPANDPTQCEIHFREIRIGRLK